jgi:hypothetical protein
MFTDCLGKTVDNEIDSNVPSTLVNGDKHAVVQCLKTTSSEPPILLHVSLCHYFSIHVAKVLPLTLTTIDCTDS